MPSLFGYAIAALAVPTWALAQTTLMMSSCGHITGKPVVISAPEAHRVLSHHLHAADATWMDAEHTMAESPNLWHHLSGDAVKYDAKMLFEPEDSHGNVVVVFHGLQGEENLFPSTLKATHEIPAHLSPSKESFDALASLYASSVSGVQSSWADYEEKSASALDRLQAELAHIASLVSGPDMDLQALGSARIQALADVKREFGSESKTYKAAKEQVKSTLEALLERVERLSGAKLALIHTSENASTTHERRAQAPLSQQADLLEPFIATMPTSASNDDKEMPMGQLPSCPASREELEKATNKCHGHGKAIQSSKGGEMCWRCQCGSTRENGRTTNWAGAACEKQDVSSQTLLVLGTVAVLFVSIVCSIALLYREGTHELPGTLASVSLRPT
ncbi:hypothetical protein ACI68E_002979 [Malassezia pachydermatis]|uniref:Vacuolar sorting protein Vps3844 C-terminal domain-containing protein n=1 Tax=Malassezia pachydermatis TaxID=77020 RepID=A0A0M9VP19_9BASI|nr:putative protein kinase [Malassezia pachydermatis]KOS13939.1 putative protein kinase [Malassezia pachydermatis]